MPAEEAQHIVDLFLSGVHIRNNGYFPTSEQDFKLPLLNLNNVRRSFNSVKVELTSMLIDNMKIDLSGRTLNHIAAERICYTRKSPGLKKLLDDIVVVVGIDRDAEQIRDKLVEDKKKVDVVSIVGMGGIGKTTLATKVFNDRFVVHHFYVRAWVTVSQKYDMRDVLIQILASVGVKPDLDIATNSKLREMVYKHLMGKRYLIVIDDIWHIETWDNMKLFFPHDNTGSRILLTSRLVQVAKHANSEGLIHHLGYLSKEKSWELLCQKVFHDNEFPKWSIKPGMQIVENCQGLPLAVVVIAGVLAKHALSERFWVEIADRTSSYIVGDQNGCLETLALSYDHLPLHLRECFLYLGGFPVDYKFHVQRLIWLWVAEGFIQEDGSRRLEDIAEGYLIDLIDRNLLIVDCRKSNGGVKVCKVHHLVRELCLKKTNEERFLLKIKRQKLYSQVSNVTTPPYKPVRMFINEDAYDPDFAHPPSQSIRSIVCFSEFRSLNEDIAKYFGSFVLLRVLDLQKCRLSDFPYSMELLVHLRYLAISNSSEHFPSSICKLWNLQTLIYIKTTSFIVDLGIFFLPSNISDLVNLRHLWCYYAPDDGRSDKGTIFLRSIEKPMNLQTISNVKLGNIDNFQKCFPCIKELTCRTYEYEDNDFKSLTCLENLKLTGYGIGKSDIKFPATLTTLALSMCNIPWSGISIIQSLPNLQVLKLKNGAFMGSCWNTAEHVFPKLKFLRLDGLNIEVWETCSRSFPCLRQLEIIRCYNLEEIPLEIGDIPTLELIQIEDCRQCVGESVRRIQEEQHDYGNYYLRIGISKTRKRCL
ncbi:putative P-loop containing nucleoside triphosphate hydrolase, leucine-rich repeat domain superfamily [Helianthus debilis subsp. tardiflorus]